MSLKVSVPLVKSTCWPKKNQWGCSAGADLSVTWYFSRVKSNVYRVG